MSLKPAELKFLLKLIGFPGYKGPLTKLSPSSGTKRAELERICQQLADKQWVNYLTEITSFSIAAPGRILLTLDTTSRPVTPDELKLLKKCGRGALTPSALTGIPPADQQRLIRGLVNRRLLKIRKESITDVWLTEAGIQFLLKDFSPEGNSLVATGKMLGNYVHFLRAQTGLFP